jgi:hypothetical protein
MAAIVGIRFRLHSDNYQDINLYNTRDNKRVILMERSVKQHEDKFVHLKKDWFYALVALIGIGLAIAGIKYIWDYDATGIITSLCTSLQKPEAIPLLKIILIGILANILAFAYSATMGKAKEYLNGLSFGLIFGLIGGLIFGLIGGLSGGLIGGLIFGLFGRLSD